MSSKDIYHSKDPQKQSATLARVELMEQLRGAKASVGQLLNDLIPPLHKYMLWAAKNGAGIYSKASNEEAKADVKLYSNIGGSTKKQAKGVLSETIAEGMPALSVLDQQKVYETQGRVKDICESILTHVKGMHEYKNEMLKELYKLDRILQQDIFDQMTSNTLENFNKWIDQVTIKLIP